LEKPASPHFSAHGLAQARTEEEANAIAAAMARVEAEAREKAEAEAHPREEMQTTDAIQPQAQDEVALEKPASPHFSAHGLAQARTTEEADAIAAAMARVEAEAREKAAAEAHAKVNAPSEEAPASPDIQRTSDEPTAAERPVPDAVSNP